MSQFYNKYRHLFLPLNYQPPSKNLQRLITEKNQFLPKYQNQLRPNPSNPSNIFAKYYNNYSLSVPKPSSNNIFKSEKVKTFNNEFKNNILPMIEKSNKKNQNFQNYKQPKLEDFRNNFTIIQDQPSWKNNKSIQIQNFQLENALKKQKLSKKSNDFYQIKSDPITRKKPYQGNDPQKYVQKFIQRKKPQVQLEKEYNQKIQESQANRHSFERQQVKNQQQLNPQVNNISTLKYEKANQYQFINHRLNDIKKVEQKFSKIHQIKTNQYTEALNRRRLAKSKSSQRKKILKKILQLKPY